MLKYHIQLLLGFLAVSGCKAQSGLKTKEVFMYKNGFTYVHAEGKVNSPGGVWSLSQKDIPNALFGTIWFQSKGGIQYVLKENDTLQKPVDMPGLEQLLALNKGKKVKITLSAESTTPVVEGTVLQVFENKEKADMRYAYNTAIATIRTASGDVVITQNTLGRVLFAEFETGASTAVTEKKVEPRISVHFKDNSSTTDLGMVYLEKHDAWAPVYRLELVSDKKAHLTLGAEIRSGKMDISGAILNLVVAQPSIYSSYLPSCLTEEGKWNSYSDEGSYSEDRMVENSSSIAKSGISVGDGKAEDYYIYSVKDFSLQKDQTAYVQLLEGDVNVEHHYTGSLPGVSEYAPVATYQEPNIPKYDVYHYLKFQNSFKQPLTAAPVFVEGKNPGGGNLVLGQPVLNTTAVGGESWLQVARSLDVPLTLLEVELSRVEGAKVIDNKSEGQYFDLVTVEAKMHVENQGDKEIELTLNRNIQGKPLKSDLEWKVVTKVPNYQSPNSNSDVTWNVKLKPGEKRDVVYTYEYYLRRY